MSEINLDQPRRRRIPTFDEIFASAVVPHDRAFPLGEEQFEQEPNADRRGIVVCAHAWEYGLDGDVIAECERRLILEARSLQVVAIDVLKSYFDYEKERPVNLGIVVRSRNDLLGPRISWVRFRGRSRSNSTGHQYTPTQPIKMQGRFQYSFTIFRKFPVEIRASLEVIEMKAAWIRFRTERLAKLRDLCRETKTMSKRMR